MKALFYIISVCGSIYFLMKKRHFDIYTLAFFSAIIYFIPGFFGYVIYPGQIKVPLEVKTYTVFILVLISIFLIALYKDMKRDEFNKKGNKEIMVIEGKYTLSILVIISILVTTYGIIVINKDLLGSKMDIAARLGSMFTLLIYSASLAFTISFVDKKKTQSIISFILLLFIFLIGFRSPVALSVLAVIMLRFKESKRIRLISYNFMYIILILLFGYFMIMGKVFYGAFKTQGLTMAISRLFDKEYIRLGFLSMEPFGIQAILNEIIVRRFYVGFDHLKDIVYQLLVVPSLFGGNTQAFNTIIQTELFPGLNYGMAYNIWAEAIASGGFGFLLVVIIIYVFVLFILDRFMESNNNVVKATGALIGSYWSFYIHRSSIAVQLTYTRHILYTIFIAFFISVIISIIFNPIKGMKIR